MKLTAPDQAKSPSRAKGAFWRRPMMAGLLAFALPLLSVASLSIFTAPSVSAAAQQITIPARANQQTGFSRLTFDFPVEVPFSVEKRGNRLDIRFEASFTPAFSTAFEAGLDEFSGARFTNTNGVTTVSLTVGVDSYARQYRRQSAIIVDLYAEMPAFIRDRQQRLEQLRGSRRNAGSAGGAGGSAAGPAQQTNEAEAKPEAEKTEVKAPAAGGPLPPGAGMTLPGQQEKDPADKPDEKPAEKAEVAKPDDQADAKEDAKEEEEPKPKGKSAAETGRDLTGIVQIKSIDRSGPKPAAIAEKKTEDVGPDYVQGAQRQDGKQNLDVKVDVIKKTKGVQISPNRGKADGASTVSVEVTSLPDLVGVTFTFDMPSLAPAAVFERYGNLWVVFDGKMGLDMTGFEAGERLLQGRVQGIYPQEHKDATVVRMAIRANQNIITEVVNNKWIVHLKDTPTRPRFPLSPQRRNDTLNGNHIFIEASEIGSQLTIEDPTIDDQIIVLPLVGMGRGLAYARTYTEAVLMQTAQGVVIEPLSDKVIVNRFRNGIAIKTAILSDPTNDNNVLAQKLIDFKTWRKGPPSNFRRAQSSLKLRLSMMRDKRAKNKIRWDLARFYLAHERPGDALGMLALVLENDPKMEQRGDFLAVRGISNFKTKQFTKAGQDLFKTTLNGEQDIELWRAMIKEQRGETKDSLDHYRRGKDMIGGYAQQDRATIQLAVIRAALAESQYKLAEQELSLFGDLDQGKLRQKQVLEARYLKGKLAEQEGRQSEALAIYDALSQAPNYRLAAYARLARVKHNIEMNDISEQEAIEKLERMRFAYRGPKFESQVTDLLSDLYIDKGMYVEAFELVRNNMPYFEEEANELNLVDKMRDLYKRLFADGESDRMPAIKAVSIFFEYQEYRPKGVEGDTIVLKLADKLVEMDLLDKAAELYWQQVKVMETRAAKADIAADLARIYIMDRKPEKALDVISASRSSGLPPDIIDKRRWVEAKALIEMGKFEEAEFRLEDDGSVMAKELRADLYWGAEDWEKVVASTDVYLADSLAKQEPLDQKQRLYLIRNCIAMTYLQDKTGLQRLRSDYGKQMRVGDLKTAFEILTNQEELSGFEVSSIVEQIANINSLKNFMQNYRTDFSVKRPESGAGT